ncbi:uncharacterized protein LOC100897508 [Galendromus occidentalis]|uniref:Uncharacterized protein LOC100897508 n=1 Tax=Galendromus occidentalis TaxID=34638 RepID=A0AAJ7L8B8_9ACAR|nr:uncharacterized protein LOC100897508 [Galendromus occidentalis]
MPKLAKTVKSRIELLKREFGTEVFTSDGDVLTCKPCAKAVNTSKKYHVQQHVNGATHKERVRLAKTADQSLCLLTNYVELSKKESSFSMDLCQMMIECNIPLYKVQNLSFRRFHAKWCNGRVPDQASLRKNYLKKLYDATITRIRDTVGENRIWVSVDETTDSRGLYVVNTIVGCLTSNEASVPMLLGTEIVERTNHATVAQPLTNALNLLWPQGIKHERVLLFISDAAPYMIKAGTGLKVLFPKLVHVTCLAHAVHRVCEEIRVSCPSVDALIANVKKVFAKAPSRIRVFKDLAPNLPLPPEPVLTRWGTWLNAALYYAVNLDVIENVLEKLESTDAAAIRKSKELAADREIRSQLASIASNFSRLPGGITKLECTSQRLSTTLAIIDDIKRDIVSSTGQKSHSIKSKFERVLDRNPGFAEMKIIQITIEGEVGIGDVSDLTVTDLSSFT